MPARRASDIAQPPASRTAELVARIRGRILDGDLAEGDLFMTEEQVSTEFGTSRRVAREAVNHLRALGVLRARRRKGLVVAQPDPVELLSGSVPFFGRSEANFIELARFRYTLEIGSVDLAVRNATEEQVAQLEALADQFARAVRRGKTQPEALLDLEYRFHRTILDATGSTLVAGLHHVLLDFFTSAGRLSNVYDPNNRDSFEETAWGHRMIARAFRNRDIEQARAAMRHHLRQDFELQTSTTEAQ